MLLFAIMLFSLYAFYQFSFWHLARYMYPLAFVATLYLGPVTVWAFRNVFLHRTSRAIPMDKFVLGLFLLVFLSFALQFYFFLYKNAGCEGGNGFIQASNWINENTPEDAVIGFYQGGVLRVFHRPEVSRPGRQSHGQGLGRMACAQGMGVHPGPGRGLHPGRGQLSRLRFHLVGDVSPCGQVGTCER